MTTILPLGLLDKAISSRVWILMKDDREFEGTLRGFDDFFNMVLENVIELDGGKKNKLESILLNGTQICLIVPGGEIS
ncbi:unnamed protein product (macronuclear) [Paramecium tetraurelia]|uniref:U6 snRNA-associated Sm-like protein LSm5 n=1 Tax=Paramecium tetraurelia TaxID=5888 RepID=A0BY51_PARTE|nr:uncharacterized protein GSPATT00033321001 [Paramecium tetraurelia]CAK63468.1 unnamed protein product [Paramecium tetraurelia]|eukprot:XP_001430866.1 hypothetical protein (macronuclear) [Paramecium tetraurelia strain d4-2]